MVLIEELNNIKYMKQSILSMLAVFTILFASCGGAKNVAGNDANISKLTGHKWQLIEIGGKEISTVTKRTLHLSLIPSESRYAVTGGCNTLNGAYSFTKKAGGIKFSQGISTMMACDDMEIDREVISAVTQTSKYAVEDEILVLYKGSTPLAKFKAVAADSELAGTWELDYIQGGNTPFNELFPQGKPTINFDLNAKKVNGKGACNNYNATVEINGRNIKIGPVASTRMGCPGNGEGLYFETLQKVNVISVNGDTMTLIIGDVAVMRFARR